MTAPRATAAAMAEEAERRPVGKGGVPDGAVANSNVNATVARTRCKFLHPTHLTGCRQPAEPGSVYCTQHGGAT